MYSTLSSTLSLGSSVPSSTVIFDSEVGSTVRKIKLISSISSFKFGSLYSYFRVVSTNESPSKRVRGLNSY